MKKVLFLTAFVPNYSGAAEKNTVLLLEDLSKKFKVDLLYFKAPTEKEYVPDNSNIKVLNSCNITLVRKIWNVLSFPILHPLFTVKFDKKILAFLKQQVKFNKYDAIVCEHSQMLLYAKYLDAQIPKLLYSHDVIVQRVGRTSSKFTTWLCRKSENFCLKTPNSTCYSVSQKDCDIIKKEYGILAYPCLAYVSPLVVNAKPIAVENQFVFIGKWSRADNLDGVIYFFDKVVPLIKEDIKVSIIGKDFPTERICNNNHHVKLEVLGFVDNPYAIIANSRALLAPLFTGAGTKQKVFESLACGTPVIGTDIAFEGINTKFCKYMILCNEPQDFANALLDVDFPIGERLDLKTQFIASYHSKTLPEYIEEILNK